MAAAGYTAINYDDVLAQLRDAGLIVEYIEAGTSRPQRVRIEGSREKKGWYWLREWQLDDGRIALVGSFGVWVGNKNNAQKVRLGELSLSKEQSQAIRDRMAADRKRADAIRKRELEVAARRAQRMFIKCQEIKERGACAYLLDRDVDAHGARMTPNGTLVVPMMNAAGDIRALQFIGPEVRRKRKDTNKQYWPAGMSQTGLFFMLGAPGESGIILIAEGFVTGAVLREESGLCTVVAFDANNLLPVAQAIRRRHPGARILICADDDFASRGNPGITCARAAAFAVDGAWVAPHFPEGEPFRTDFYAAQLDEQAADHRQEVEAIRCGRKKLTDFDDLRDYTRDTAPHSVRLQIEAMLDQLGWREAKPRRDEPRQGARGERLSPITTTQELFDRFAVIYGHNKSLFDFQERMLVSAEDVKMACAGRDTFKAWHESQDKRVVRINEVGFDPSEANDRITCNLWGGWPMEPVKGECTELLAMLEHLCQNEDRNARGIYEWILKWLAYPLQHPGAKMRTALVVHGPQRVGKNFFFESVMEIYGPYGEVIDQDALEDKYNDCFSKKLFLIADEVIARQELYHVKNKLKGMITGRRIRINPKNVKSYWEDNHCNLVFLSNETQPTALERDDGRHVVLWTPSALPSDFYKRIETEIANGGIAALYWYLKHEIDLGDFNEYTPPPMTIAKQDLMELSLDSTERFMREWLRGEIDHIPTIPAKSLQVYALYRDWCGRMGYARYAPEPKFLAEITKRSRAMREQAHYLNGTGKKQARFIFPPGVECPPDKTKQIWLGECVKQFDFCMDEWKQG